ncbi:hypothetical protein TTHERM_00423340 (macronuclear) [Tetrahymena thermophila SB210]|uniref:Uncharacterized protein n=1 Tax=Tetrahymena thermophila (strain SB210) TaxID=312017 RepID=Q23AM7_TETTS|nr:hypothetical protein TTHERM_00423340 [Tetrahymena thermophila SB210]EAR93465.2 hypothetical protein TTHERM_00423340 [Tetrahymena thermophila SB210]|eukprot:XP_001013710.2 hypothetical protein TTHERM_00423340 [Tetrahymena thermophila SB210]
MFVEKINDYFINLKKQINQKIDLLHNQVKQKLIQMEDLNKNQGDIFLDIYNEISSKFDIQQLLKEQQIQITQSISDAHGVSYANFILDPNQKICYNERGDNNTITKVVKGKDVFEGKKTNIDKEIEVRIHLAQKMIKVANYPNYENIAELQNNQLILENTQYRFFGRKFWLGPVYPESYFYDRMQILRSSYQKFIIQDN